MRNMNLKIYKHDDYEVDIIDNVKDDSVDFWLYEKGYGNKSLMFGIPKYEIDFDNDVQLIDIIERNIDQYIKLYILESDAIDNKYKSMLV